jgi:hypothetical protein
MTHFFSVKIINSKVECTLFVGKERKLYASNYYKEILAHVTWSKTKGL